MNIVVGIDGTERGMRAFEWAARRARSCDAALTLVSALDAAYLRSVGVDEEAAARKAQEALDDIASQARDAFGIAQVETRVTQGKAVDALVDAAEEADLVVMGSHHGATVGETVSGAKALRVSVQISVPTAVVPADWRAEDDRGPVLVGVAPDQSSEKAVEFGVAEAKACACDLKMVSAWGLPPIISKPAEAMGGGLGPVGVEFQRNLDARVAALRAQDPELQVSALSVEGPSPSRVLLDQSVGCRMLVLGTHSRNAMGRALFGSVTHSVLLNMAVPVVVVPQD